MNLGRRLQLLACHASRQISEERRHEILAELLVWVESDCCSARDAQEKFWMLIAAAGEHLEEYCEVLQAEAGAEILQSAEASAPPQANASASEK